MKIIAPLCLLALVASFPACLSEEESSDGQTAAKTPGTGTQRTTSKPTKPAATEAPKSSKIELTDGARAAKLLADDPSIIVLDIRRPDEFSAGHIKGAMNIDFMDAGFAKKIAELDKTKRYLVHCKSGGRSGKSLEKFGEIGVSKIIHLEDGFDAWKAADHPVAK